MVTRRLSLGLLTLMSGIAGCAHQPEDGSAPGEDELLTTVTTQFTSGVNGYGGATDSQVLQSTPTTNYGAVTSLNFDGDIGGGNDAYALFRWDVSAIPLGATVQSASITLRVTNRGAVAYQLYALKRAWTEAAVTWNQASAGVPWQTAGARGANDRETTSLATIAATSIATNVKRSLISRVGIGGEFLGSGHTLRIEDSWWTGIGHGATSPLRYDGDAVHVDGPASNQIPSRNIIADVGDDCVDHSNSSFTIQDTIIHDCVDKAVSLTSGGVTVRNSLVFNARSGIRGTASVYNSTISTPSPIATVAALQESIVWPQSVSTCSGAVNYSIVGNPGDLGCGMGNLSANPLFTNPGACSYTPMAGSPALTAGPAGGRIGWPGFPSW
jgi:hypothetical protein